MHVLIFRVIIPNRKGFWIKSTKNTIFKEQLQKKLDELVWLEKHNTTREYYYMIFSETEEGLEKNIRTMFSVLGRGRGGLVEKISYEKKKEILFRVLNKCVMTNA